MELAEMQKLLSLVDRFEKVERLVYRTGESRRENDAEHTYSLMMSAWFFVSRANNDDKKLDLEKVLLYIMVHDLVEAYAGDTDSLSSQGLTGKDEREHQALIELTQDMNFFPELPKLIVSYEAQSDAESVFVKSLDKLMPVFKNLRDNGRSFKDFHGDVDFDSWVTFKETKIKDRDVFQLWLQAKDETEKRGFLANRG